MFLDESGVATDLLRRYGRSPRGQRLVDHAPFGHWQTHTILDTLAVHTHPAVRAALDQTGAALWLLPPYSPDFNPIERAFAKRKAFFRAARPRTFDEVCQLVATALGLGLPRAR